MTKKIIFFLLFFFLLSGCVTTENYVPEYRVRDRKAAQFDISSSRPFVPSSWLKHEATMEEVENEYLIRIHKKPQSKFYLTRKANLDHFKSIFTKQDRLYFFDAPEENWAELTGVQGYTIVRYGISITGLVTKMN